mgnify:CR=1
FSNNKTTPDDTLGPYVNKNISFGKHNLNFITGVNNFQSSLNENLSSENNDYTDSNTSNALNAEIHDLRVYNVNYENFIKEKICDKNITNFNDESLIFSLPIYYYDVPVMKKGLVNLY